MNNFPNDGDGLALQKMAECGINMQQPVAFEFYIDSKNKETSERVKDALEQARIGEHIEIVFDEGELDDGEEMTEDNVEFWPSWTVYVKLTIIPDYTKILQFQENLDTLSKPFGGKADGWGMCQNNIK